MACNISSGRGAGCNEFVGGIKSLYILNYDSELYDNSTRSGHDVSFLSGSGVLDVYEYDLKGATNTFDEAGEVSRDNGTSFFTQTITATFRGLDTGSAAQFNSMAKGRPHVIVEDYNGVYRIAGMENGCDVQVSTATGGAMGDLYGATVTFTGMEKNMAFFLSGEAIPSSTSTSVALSSTKIEPGS